MSAPDPRNVRDALLEAGYTAEQVDDMLRASELRAQRDALRDALRMAAWESGREWAVDARDVFVAVDRALRATGHGGVWAARGEAWDERPMPKVLP